MAMWKKGSEVLRSVLRSHPLVLVLSALLPIFGIFLLVGGVAYLGAGGLKNEYREVKSYDELVVRQQKQRIREGARGDIVIFGDSSGLMGIDPRVLERELGVSVQNFCTLAYAGPEAYATMLKEYLTRNPAPKLVLLAFHPWQLPRHKDWEDCLKYIDEKFKEQKDPILRPDKRIKIFFESALYDNFLYIPLSGSYGGYFGAQKSVETMMNTTNGSLIDANVLFLRKDKPRQARAKINGRTDLYDKSLQNLKNVLESSHLGNVALLRTPLPDHYRYDSTRIALDYKYIGETLGIHHNNLLLEGLSALPAKYFSSIAHLNRHGKAYFSKLLAEKLKPLLQSNL